MFKYIFSKDFSLSKSLFSCNNPLKEKHIYYDEIIKFFFFFVLSSFICGFFEIILKFIGFSVPHNSYKELFKLIEYYVLVSISYIISYYLTFKRSKQYVNNFPAKEYRGPKKSAPIIILLAYGFAMFGNIMSFLFNLLVNWICSIFNIKNSSFVDSFLLGQNNIYNKVDLNNRLSYIIILFLLVIVTPIIEELIFRELLYGRLVHFNIISAVFFSSIIFALSHANISQAIFAFFAGLGLAIIKRYTGKLIYCILCHILINLTAFISQFCVTDFNTMLLIYSIVFSVVACIILIKEKNIFIFRTIKEGECFKIEESVV